jgi:5-dehydro-2-deoxygluconokinase
MNMTIGYDKPLYMLPFDHRASFSKHMFGWEGPLSQEQVAEIAAAKRVIFDGMWRHVENVPERRHVENVPPQS